MKSANRKASANMWWIIIGAVIALVVMIILMLMFTEKSGGVERGLLNCESKSGQCLSDNFGNCGQTCKAVGKSYAGLGVFECETNYCCCLGAGNK